MSGSVAYGGTYGSARNWGDRSRSGTRGQWGGASPSSSEGWGATAARARRTPVQQDFVSPGGRRAAASLTLPAGRHVDHDAFDDVPPEEFTQRSYDERDPIVVLPGQAVRHKKFGKGVVERIESGDKPTVVARFPGYGPKRILAEFLDFDV